MIRAGESVLHRPRQPYRAAALVLAAVALPGGWVYAAPAGRIAILAGTVMPIAGPALSPGMVLISGGKIDGVQRGDVAPPGYTAIDAAGSYVLPGLVDAHTHYGLKNPSGRFDVADIAVHSSSRHPGRNRSERPSLRENP